MPFESVYRVSDRISAPAEADVDRLARRLGVELPVGYREYVTTFGPGTLSDFLIVKMPAEITDPQPADREYHRLLFGGGDWLLREGLTDPPTPEELEQATVFAYASAEAPRWFTCRRKGNRLFEIAECDMLEIKDGFYGLVERCTTGQKHEFPFFEPKNGRRRMRQLYVGPGLGRAGFVEAMARRWGRESLRCSRNSPDELYPVYFVPEIEGRIELHLDPEYPRLPAGSFFVRARYDIDSEGRTRLWPPLLRGVEEAERP
jgi:hypothetical protein